MYFYGGICVGLVLGLVFVITTMWRFSQTGVIRPVIDSLISLAFVAFAVCVGGGLGSVVQGAMDAKSKPNVIDTWKLEPVSGDYYLMANKGDSESMMTARVVSKQGISSLVNLYMDGVNFKEIDGKAQLDCTDKSKHNEFDDEAWEWYKDSCTFFVPVGSVNGDLERKDR